MAPPPGAQTGAPTSELSWITGLAPGDLVVPTVRRPGGRLYDRIGHYDMTTDDVYFERGINLRLRPRGLRDHGAPRVAVGTVNANRESFELGAADFASAELECPGWLASLLIHPVQGLERHAAMMGLLREEKDAIKVLVNVAGE